MEKGKQTLVFSCKYLKMIFCLGPALSGSIGRKNYLDTDISLNIPDGLNTEVLCGSRIDPETKLILKHNYACKTASLIDPRLDKTHCLLENMHLIRIGLQKDCITLTTLAQLFIMPINVTLRFYIFNCLLKQVFVATE